MKDSDPTSSLHPCAISDLPVDLQERIGCDLYGGYVQYYIIGVDGSLAPLGFRLPDSEVLREIVAHADIEHVKLVRRHNRSRRKSPNQR